MRTASAGSVAANPPGSEGLPPSVLEALGELARAAPSKRPQRAPSKRRPQCWQTRAASWTFPRIPGITPPVPAPP